MESYLLDIRGWPDDQCLTARCLQGLVNRNEPRLFLQTGFWNWPPADEFWPEYLTSRKGVRFRPLRGLVEALGIFGESLKGAVLWDPELDESRWAALSMAGCNNLLPLPAVEGGSFGLPVIDNLAGRFESGLDLLAWSVDRVLPGCSDALGLHVEQAWSGPSVDAVDLAVAGRGFVFAVDLKPGAPGRNMELFHEVLSSFRPGALIYGWGEPEELYAQAVSFHDQVIMCAEAPNLSFWAALPAERREWQRPKGGSGRQLADKHYIALCMSEGDSPKMAVSVQGGAWLDPARGTLPLNWGMNPLFIEEFPALAEYYWDTAGENDYFVGGASGAGYTLPDKLANPDEWMKRTGRIFKTAGMSSTEAWMHFSRPVYERYARLSGLKAFSLPCGPFGVTGLNDGRAVAFLRGNSGLNYFNSSAAPGELAEAIRRHCSLRPAPSFSAPLLVPDDRRPGSDCGGWHPGLLTKVAGLLGPEYEFIALDEMADLALEALRTGRTPDCFSPGYNEWRNFRNRAGN